MGVRRLCDAGYVQSTQKGKLNHVWQTTEEAIVEVNSKRYKGVNQGQGTEGKKQCFKEWKSM